MSEEANNERISINSNKPFVLEPDLILENIDRNNVSSNIDFGTVKTPNESKLSTEERLRISKRLSHEDFIINLEDGPI